MFTSIGSPARLKVSGLAQFLVARRAEAHNQRILTRHAIHRRYQFIRKKLRIRLGYIRVMAVSQMLKQTFFDILGFADVNPDAFVEQRVHSRGIRSVCGNGCAIEMEPTGSVPGIRHLTFTQLRTTVLGPDDFELCSARFRSETTEWSRCKTTPQIKAASPRLDSFLARNSRIGPSCFRPMRRCAGDHKGLRPSCASANHFNQLGRNQHRPAPIVA